MDEDVVYIGSEFERDDGKARKKHKKNPSPPPEEEQEFEREVCTICYEALVEADAVMLLCSHRFCTICIRRCILGTPFDAQKKCPVCKKPIDTSTEDHILSVLP